MTDRRTDDPQGFDATPFRAEDPLLQLRYRHASLSARGLGVFLALSVLSIMASNLASGWMVKTTVEREISEQTAVIMREHASRSSEHLKQIQIAERGWCWVGMPDARRERFRLAYQPGAFRVECPWISE